MSRAGVRVNAAGTSTTSAPRSDERAVELGEPHVVADRQPTRARDRRRPRARHRRRWRRTRGASRRPGCRRRTGGSCDSARRARRRATTTAVLYVRRGSSGIRSGVPPPTIHTPCWVASSRRVVMIGPSPSVGSAIGSLSPSPRPRNEKHSGSTTSFAPSEAARWVRARTGREVRREVVGGPHLHRADPELPTCSCLVRYHAGNGRAGDMALALVRSRWYPTASFIALRWGGHSATFFFAKTSRRCPATHFKPS